MTAAARSRLQLTANPFPVRSATLYAPLRPAVERAGPDLTATIKANAEVQANLLRRGSPVIAELAGQGKLKVITAYYDLASSKVTVLG